PERIVPSPVVWAPEVALSSMNNSTGRRAVQAAFFAPRRVAWANMRPSGEGLSGLPLRRERVDLDRGPSTACPGLPVLLGAGACREGAWRWRRSSRRFHPTGGVAQLAEQRTFNPNRPVPRTSMIASTRLPCVG